MPAILPSPAVARWQAAPFTYPEVGGTAGEHPKRYSTLRRSRRLRRRDFSQAAEELMSWQVHERAGLRIAVSSPRAAVGTVVTMRLGIGRATITAPCRVVYVIDTPARAGFAYGTLPGHPESGEELFVIGHDTDGTLTFTVSAFSRPASRLVRAGGPLTRWVQQVMTSRYLRALDGRRSC